MSRLTRIAPSKLGEMRFPKGSNADFDPKVKTWTMTREEMDEYFMNGGGSKMKTKPEITKEKYEELTKQGLNDATISKRWGINQGSLIYQKKKWYGEEKTVKQPKETAEEKQPIAAARLASLHVERDTYKKENDELKQLLLEANERIAQLEGLVNELADEKDNLTAACEDLEHEIERYKQAQINLGQTVRAEAENKLLRQLLKVVL